MACDEGLDVGGGVLVLGGVRSGKTSYGMGLGRGSGRECIYVATAEVFDDEMKFRVDAHREERGDSWRLVEESSDLGGVIRRESGLGKVLLVDCLTVWLGQAMYEGGGGLGSQSLMEDRVGSLLDAVRDLRGEGIIFVSNETGFGVIAADRDVRMFGDMLGLLHQSLARELRYVRMVVAGCPLALKG